MKIILPAIFAGLFIPSMVLAQSFPGAFPAVSATNTTSVSSGVSRPSTPPSTQPYAPPLLAPSTAGISSLSKEQADKMYCMFVYSLSGVVVKNPVSATAQCKKMALLKYDMCISENGGADPLVPTSIPGRSVRKCASQRNLELEVCDALVDIAKDLRKACEDNMLTLFPEAPVAR